MSLTIDPTGATTLVNDVVDVTNVRLSSSSSVLLDESNSIDYTATLGSPALTPLTVNLSNGTSIVIQAGMISGSTQFDVADDAYINGDRGVTARITSTSGGGFEAVVADRGVVQTVVQDDSDTTSISLDAELFTTGSQASTTNVVQYTATLSANAREESVVVVLSNGGTIRIPEGENSGFVDVPVPTLQHDTTVSAFVRFATGRNFENLAQTSNTVTTEIAGHGCIEVFGSFFCLPTLPG